MATKNTLKFSSAGILAIALGLFFLVSGIYGLTVYNRPEGELVRGLSRLFGSDTSLFTLVVSLTEIGCGVVLVLFPFGLLKDKVRDAVALIVFVLWIVKLIFELFVYREILKPSPLSWLQDLALNLVIAFSVWQLRSKA